MLPGGHEKGIGGFRVRIIGHLRLKIHLKGVAVAAGLVIGRSIQRGGRQFAGLTRSTMESGKQCSHMGSTRCTVLPALRPYYFYVGFIWLYM